MKKIRKIICAVLCMALLFTMIVPSYATTNNVSMTSFQLSSNSSLKIEYHYTVNNLSAKQNASAPKLESFTVSQYYNGDLIQTVLGTPGGDKIFVTNYEKNGIVTGVETILTADRVEFCDPVNVESSNAKASQTTLGYITYKPTAETGQTNRIRVYSEQTGHDRRSYVINGKATDTVAIITNLIISVLAAIFIPPLAVAKEIAVAIIMGVGGSIVAETIGVAFSESVSVDAYDYTLTGYDYTTARYTLGYDGTANQVKTVNSNYYNKWFYDGFTPANWKHNTLAYWFWCDLFAEAYPQVKSYS